VLYLGNRFLSTPPPHNSSQVYYRVKESMAADTLLLSLYTTQLRYARSPICDVCGLGYDELGGGVLLESTPTIVCADCWQSYYCLSPAKRRALYSKLPPRQQQQQRSRRKGGNAPEQEEENAKDDCRLLDISYGVWPLTRALASGRLMRQ
jgi:hypothetical protein